MKIVNLGESGSILNQFVAEMRDVGIQKDRMRFRRNIERIGEIMAYEISRDFTYGPRNVTSPLGTAVMSLSDDKLVIGTILRAGLPFHQGFLNYWDMAENAFVSAYRKYKDRLNFDVHIEYIASPDLEGKTLILTDPMLATGSSMELAYKALLTKGEPRHTHLVSIIASKQAIAYMRDLLPADRATIWTGAIDNDLNDHSYIVPGLGDVGDLAYGEKE
ncbi:MAG: uracil phosphoribosyltransferase [Tannerellaceae bacterium]|jgi:uracil phosphoribosyltransferase|nr:uracil phosphoribosyltransferase [Tannerellaceae bacterium]